MNGLNFLWALLVPVTAVLLLATTRRPCRQYWTGTPALGLVPGRRYWTGTHALRLMPGRRDWAGTHALDLMPGRRHWTGTHVLRLMPAFLVVLGLVIVNPVVAADKTLADLEKMEGFVNLYWDAADGKLFLEIDALDTPMIYQSSLPRGVGSNDLGLDRGQLGATRVVRFLRSGPRILLVEDNLAYRAESDDADERQAIAESFARSVIWGFKLSPLGGERLLVDATDFLLRDAHGLGRRLTRAGEGTFKVDGSRSAIYLPRTKAFPDNSEIEAIVTLVGQPGGPHLPTVVPDPTAVTVHMHHSFIRLPDDNYEPLIFDPRSAVIDMSILPRGFADYATPIGESLFRQYGIRHRLEKVDPTAAVSEAVEPIVYYLDRGAPEPVRSALLDGARWWNQAFEAAGYRNAFQVKILPPDADPMDVRYNVIQWVHRSTRGWSYGSSVIDPRTGEILKGHVTLGSLRVRQDYLIIEALLAPYADEAIPDTMLEVALARIRQLSAHEVGHTIGFVHNFAASTQDRSSVMDYPFPLVRFNDDGSLDFSAAYDDKIGSWDKRTVIYAYQDFPDDVDANAARAAILEETIAQGFKFVADRDARSVSTAHPDGNLWDNGADALVELDHLLRLRQYALERFSQNNIRPGRPLATLEETLVPLYLLHRFQIQAVGKLIGGHYYDYALRGDGQAPPVAVAAAKQQQAIDALIGALQPEVLTLSDEILAAIPPRPPGFAKDRETFTGHTGVIFDPLAPAAAAASLTFDVLLNPQRAARLQRGNGPSFNALLEQLLRTFWTRSRDHDDPVARQTAGILLGRLIELAAASEIDASVRGAALDSVRTLEGWLARQDPSDRALRAHYGLAREAIDQLSTDPLNLPPLPPVVVPPGSPIGSDNALGPTM